MEDSCTPRSNYKKGQMVGVITVMGLSNANQLVGFLLLITSSSALAAAQAPSSPFSTLSPLRALVPLKTGFTEFVSWSGSPQNATFNGFSVQVFEMAVQRLPFSLPYKLVPFGDGKSNPSYNDMVHMLAQGEADAIVADLTINNERLKMVDFTQPYMQSALMMVTPFKYGSIGTLWDFLQPFSMELWIAIMVAFFGTGFVMFILEHKNPDFHQSQTKPPNEFDDDDRPPAHATTFQYRLTKSVKRLVNVYWLASYT